MGSDAKKTEHAGPKRGRGAFYGPKAEAKRQGKRVRRSRWKQEIRGSAVHDTAGRGGVTNGF